jgi:single-strand DNA-binding protein
VAGEYLAKGRPVLIEGRLQLDTWDDKESGQKRSKLRVVGENMTMLGSRGEGGPRQGSGGGGGRQSGGGDGGGDFGGPQGGGPQGGGSSGPGFGGGDDFNDDDVPF